MRANYRRRIAFFWLALTMSATALFMPTRTYAQTCIGNIQVGCLNSGAVCSPVQVGGGSSGHCTAPAGLPAGERECNCAGTPEPPPPPSPRPWDVLESPRWGKDQNGFLRNPVWAWATTAGDLRDVCDSCPCREGTFGFDAPDQVQDFLGSPTCTIGPIHENSNNLCSGGIVKTIKSNASGMGYHMNWFPVRYEGSKMGG
jgi:hypothetical protein